MPQEQTLILVRHGESVANIAQATNAPGDISLTPRGHRQAEDLSKKWTTSPNVIFSSPYRRALQTAEPTAKRFKSVKFVTGPIYEFTYLCPDDWRGSTPEDRRASVLKYWERCDPNYHDGTGAERFVDFMDRIDIFLEMIQQRDDRLIVAFTHEQFIKTLLWRLSNESLPVDPVSMADCRDYLYSFKIDNCSQHILLRSIDDHSWSYVEER